MYKLCLACSLVIMIISCNTQKNIASKNADKEDWIPLFNKKDLTGWDIKIAGFDLNDNAYNTFYVKDGMLVVDYSKYEKFTRQFGHIYYKQPYSYYKVRVEYQFYGKQLTGGPSYAYLNSGVMLHSQSAVSVGKQQTFPVSLELQLLACDSVIKNHTGNLCTPGTIVSMNGKIRPDHCIDSNSPYYDQTAWVSAEGVVYGDSLIHHIIDGDTVLTYEKPMIAGDFVNSSFNFTSGGFGADSVKWIQSKNMALTSGYIALQAESHPIRFRKVELLNLEGCMDKTALNYKSYYIKADNSKCRYK